MFEKASRIKLRFESPQGKLLVEDLWNLPLTSSTGRANLDDIARGLHRSLKESETESFVNDPPKADEAVKLGFEIVKRIIAVRKEENAAASLAASNREKKQQLLALIAQKETEQLAGQSIDDLKKMVEDL